MVGQRKSSTRLRNDSALRRQSLVKEEERSPSASAEPDHALPSKLQVGMPLPSAPSMILGLETNDYQSFKESGVALQSLQQSKQTWFNEGIFERYWAKPSKKRPEIDSTNPPKDSMSKLGLCTLTIEPHSFECTVFAVRDVLSSADSQRSSQGPGQLSRDSPMQFDPMQIDSPSSTGITHSGHRTPASSFAGHSELPPSENPVGDSRYLPSVSQPPEPAPKPSPDPVIQMLASRAAADNGLKELMKVVASGAATTAELKVFSAHIDALNAILKESQIQKERKASNSLHGSERQFDGRGQTAQPYHTHQDIRPKHSVQSKGDIKAVALEFNAGSGDRFLFPKNSILEYKDGGFKVIASFLVVQTGEKAYGTGFAPGKEYHQPMTISLRAHHPRILEPLSRVVGGPADVCNYMTEVMHKTPRAEFKYLALRLPKQEESGGDEDEHATRESSNAVAQQPVTKKRKYTRVHDTTSL